MFQPDYLASLKSIKSESATGSYKGMRWQMAKKDDLLMLTIYPEPYNLEHTPENEREITEYPFSEEGRCKAVEHLAKEYERQIDRWSKAPKI